jgi:uncharacterized protein (TIGR03437 family)
MKCISVFLLTAALGMAADYITGQAARVVIGQETFTSQLYEPTEWVLGGVGGVAVAGNTLFVADSSRAGAGPLNHRVLIYPTLSTLVPDPTLELQYNRKCPVCLGSPCATCRGSASVVLGQPDFSKADQNTAATQNGLRLPTAVASDGVRLVVADTDHNRVLIWNRIPLTNNAPADVVVGQADFKTASLPGQVPNAKSLRGPQGVWLQNGKLYIADTQNHRVLIYNSIPTTNGASADVVLGQPNLTAFVEPDISQAKVDAQPTNMLNPVSVTSDGVRLFVTDLGHNRVLIWNRIPTSNAAPADLVVGQPDLTTSLPNNSFSTDSSGNRSKVMCDSNGTDSDGKPTFPDQCSSTLSFPRFALSDGTRLYVADGGNDRVLIFSKVPTSNGQTADFVLGQLGGDINQATDAADSLRAPNALAWDGSNLYVTDSYNRRINVYTPGENNLPYTGVRNLASQEIFAVGEITFAGTVKEGDEVTIKIGPGSDTGTVEYKYKIVKDDTFDKIVVAVTNLINAARNGEGDENVFATPNKSLQSVILTARKSGDLGNAMTLETSLSTNAVITATTSGATLSGGQDAAKIAPGTMVRVFGDNLGDSLASARPDQNPLPDTLAGVQVYLNGIKLPLQRVGPTNNPDNPSEWEIQAQVPFEIGDTTSVSVYVRTVRRSGSISFTTPRAVTIVAQNPGIYTYPPEPDTGIRRGQIFHGSSRATGTVSVDGTAAKGDVAKVTVEDREYSYTVQDGDTLATIRDRLVDLINQDPQVEAFSAGLFTRIRLRARIEGPDGNGIKFGASAPEGAQVIMTATNTTLCCANVKGAPVTYDNPALPGETVIVRSTGLGLPIADPASVADAEKEGVSNTAAAIRTGYKYIGPAPNGSANQPREFVSSLAGGKTANVLSAGLKQGEVGIYEVELELNSDIPTNPYTQVTIAQDIYVSNVARFPVVNPNPQ